MIKILKSTYEKYFHYTFKENEKYQKERIKV